MGWVHATVHSVSKREQLNMKLILLIPLIACGYAAKLDRTYLPPASAATAGGGPGSLIAPGSGSFGQAPLDSSSDFGRQPGPSGFGEPSFGQGTIKPGAGQSGQSYNGFNQPSGSSSFGQSSGPAGFGSVAYNQPGTGSGYGQTSGTGFGSSSASQSNFLGSSQSGFNQGSSFNQNQGSNNIQAYNQPQRSQAAAEQSAQILKYDNQNDGDNFSYSFETSNGIRAEESGTATNGVRAQGGFAYIGDDGQDYSITYTADENGYQPQGQHLPTPPPIPEEILKSIEENARAAAAGTQEGAYRPEEYENEGTSEAYNSAGSSFSSPSQNPSQLYGPSKFDSGSNQGAQGFNQQGSQGFNALGQNQGIGQGNRQSISAPGNQYSQQGQYGTSGSAQNSAPYGVRGPQSQSSFGQAAGFNEGLGQLFGQGSGFNQGKGQSSIGQSISNQGQGFGGLGKQGQPTFGQGPGSNQGQSFGGQGGSSQSGYEYNRPQSSGQFGSQSPSKPGPQSTSTSFSRPGSGSSQGPFGPSAQSGAPSYGTPSQSGQGQYRPGQSTFGSGPSSSSLFGQAPTGSQSQFGPPVGLPSGSASQGRPDSFSGPRQPPSFNVQEGYKY